MDIRAASQEGAYKTEPSARTRQEEVESLIDGRSDPFSLSLSLLLSVSLSFPPPYTRIRTHTHTPT